MYLGQHANSTGYLALNQVIYRLYIRCLSSLNPRLYTIPLPPSPNPPIDLFTGHAIPHKTKSNPQFRLNVPVARLVVKKQHILVCNPTGPIDARKVLRLGTREDLHIVEVFQRPHCLRLAGCRVIRERRDDVQRFEHIAGQIRGKRTRGQRERNRVVFAGVDNRRYGGIEGKRLTPAGFHVLS